MQGKNKKRQRVIFLTPKFLEKQQALLEAILKKYQELVQAARRGISVGVEDVGGGGSGDLLDRAAIEGERLKNAQELCRCQDIIRQIKEALSLVRALLKGKRGGDEEYGKCLDCDGRIPQRRLEAVPWALLCTPCQRKRESITVSG